MKRALLLLSLVVFAAQAAPVPHRLVDLATLQPPPLFEIRYASPYNFTGAVLYPAARAWLHRDAAAALERVQRDLARDGLGLKVFDGYRPLSVQQRMWDLIRDERYVSNPAVNRGRHTRGTAVDVTLVDKLGNELAMPTPFDDFTEAAHRDAKTITPEQRANLDKLEAAMARHGFELYPFEWWHYDLKGWKGYPVLDVSIEALARGDTTAEPVP